MDPANDSCVHPQEDSNMQPHAISHISRHIDFCIPWSAPINFSKSINTSNYLLQTLVTETMAGGFLLLPLLIGHPGAPTHFPSFPQTSVPVPVQAKQKINLFLSHVILAPVYLSMSVYWQRMLSSELLLKESIMTGKDTRLFNPTHLGLGVGCGVIIYVAYNSKTSSVLLHACVLSRFSTVPMYYLDPMYYCPPGSCVHGILQGRILEWVAMPSSRGSSWPRDRTCVSCCSCIAGTCDRWITGEAPSVWDISPKFKLLSHCFQFQIDSPILQPKLILLESL